MRFICDSECELCSNCGCERGWWDPESSASRDSGRPRRKGATCRRAYPETIGVDHVWQNLTVHEIRPIPVLPRAQNTVDYLLLFCCFLQSVSAAGVHLCPLEIPQAPWRTRTWISAPPHSLKNLQSHKSLRTPPYTSCPLRPPSPKLLTTDTPTQAPPHPLHTAQPHRPHPQTSSFSEGKRRPELPPPLEVIELPKCLPPGTERAEENTSGCVCEVSLPVSESLPATLQESLSSGSPVHLQQDTQGAQTHIHTHHTVNHFCAIEIQECKLACGPRQQK